ncbi:MAG: hypothetical protein JO250_18135 [Armatimonadetes bacterium]|nr:hypothetical protein [Armatimonadota bacterium]
MNKRILALSVSALALVVPALAQDAGTPPATNSAPVNRPIPGKVLIFPPKDTGAGSLKTSRSSYRPGQPVRFTFTIANPTSKTVNYDFATSQQFDITVSDAANTQVWDWAQGKMFAQMITHVGLRPGQKKSFTAVWNGRDAQGHPIAPGVYNATARMTSSNRPAITGGVVVDNDTDPNNMGFPTRSPAENGAVRQVDVNPPITASTTVAIGVPVPKDKK